jgi:hypothetical protein
MPALPAYRPLASQLAIAFDATVVAGFDARHSVYFSPPFHYATIVGTDCAANLLHHH